VTNDTGKKLLMSVIARLLLNEPSPKDVKVNPTRAVEMIEMYTNTGWPNLDEDLCIRIFFMVLNNNFLTPNTYCYIRPVDALWCQDTKAIAGYNWYKIVHENTREAGHKWKLALQLSITKPVIQGCLLFLMVMYNVFFFVILQVPNTHKDLTIFLVSTSRILYHDNLKTITDVDPLSTPRCALYTSELIQNLQHGDERRLGTGSSRYGKCKVSHNIAPTYYVYTVQLVRMYVHHIISFYMFQSN
jgi:hypothetical protein